MLWLSADNPADWATRLPPLVLVLLILMEATYFWQLKRRAVRSRISISARDLQAFRHLEQINLVLMVLVTMVVCGRFLLTEISWIDGLWGTGLLLFVALEYSTTQYQLMNENKRDLQRLLRDGALRYSHIYRDLRS